MSRLRFTTSIVFMALTVFVLAVTPACSVKDEPVAGQAESQPVAPAPAEASAVAPVAVDAPPAEPAEAQSAQPQKSLPEAVQSGDPAVVEQVLASGAKPVGPEMDILQQAYAQAVERAKEQNAEGPSPEAYEKILNLLIARYPDMIKTGSSGAKELYTAAYFGNVNLAKILLDAGLDPNAKDGRGRGPLFDAVKRPSTDMVALLIERGADVNAKDNAGKTPLLEVAQSGLPEMAALLIDKGSDVKQTDVQGWTPLHHARYFQNEAVATVLIEKGADASVKTADGLTAEQLGSLYTLFIAVSKGETEKVASLLDATPELVNARCAVGGMPLPELLMSRAQGGFTKLAAVKEARESYMANTTPEQRDEHIAQAVSFGDGWTPLHQAVMGGELEVAKLLIEKKADVNVKSAGLELTPIYIVCIIEDKDMLQLLLDAGADLKVTDSKGNTPLHMAALYGAADSAKAIIEKGADINVKNTEGKTPLAIALIQKEQNAQANPPAMPRDYAQAIVQGMDPAKRAEIAKQHNVDPEDEEAMIKIVQENTPMTLVSPVENLLREHGAKE